MFACIHCFFSPSSVKASHQHNNHILRSYLLSPPLDQARLSSILRGIPLSLFVIFFNFPAQHLDPAPASLPLPLSGVFCGTAARHIPHTPFPLDSSSFDPSTSCVEGIPPSKTETPPIDICRSFPSFSQLENVPPLFLFSLRYCNRVRSPGPPLRTDPVFPSSGREPLAIIMPTPSRMSPPLFRVDYVNSPPTLEKPTPPIVSFCSTQTKLLATSASVSP